MVDDENLPRCPTAGNASRRTYTHQRPRGESLQLPLAHFYIWRVRAYLGTKLLGNRFLIRGNEELRTLAHISGLR